MMASCIPTLSRRGSPVVLACGPTLLASFPILWRWSGSALLSLMMRDIHHRRASVAAVSEGRWIKDRETANETCTHQLRDQESTWGVSRSIQGRRREKRAWACIPTQRGFVLHALCAAGAWHLGGRSWMRSGCGRRDIGHGFLANGRNFAMVGSFLLARPGGAAWGSTMQHRVCSPPRWAPKTLLPRMLFELYDITRWIAVQYHRTFFGSLNSRPVSRPTPANREIV